MKIQQRPTPPPLPKPSQPKPPEPPKDGPIKPGGGDAFYKASAEMAHTLAKVGGFTNGGSLGYLGGALWASARGYAGTPAFCIALAAAGGGGFVGWHVMGKVSDWAVHLADRVAPSHPVRTEAFARTGLNLAVDLLSGSPITAAIDLGLTAGIGYWESRKASKG